MQFLNLRVVANVVDAVGGVSVHLQVGWVVTQGFVQFLSILETCDILMTDCSSSPLGLVLL